MKGNLRSEITALERKVLILVSEFHKLKEELTFYKSENEQLKQELKSKSEQIGNFQNNLKITKIVDGIVVGGQNPTELKRVIDEKIKEIDKCIAHLSQ